MDRYRRFFTSLVKTYPKSIWLLVWLAALEWIWISQFRDNRSLASFYIYKIFRPLGNFLRAIFNHGSVHFGIIILILFLILTVAYIFRKFQKKEYKLLIISVLIGVNLLIPYYMFHWGFTYGLGYKNNLNYNPKSELETKIEVEQLTQFFIEKSRQYKHFANTSESFDSIQNKANQLNSVADFNSNGILKIKTGAFSEMLASLGTSGFYCFWTGELFVSNIHKTSALPFVISHEIGHATGYGPEDEANYYAFKKCIAANDSLFKYSAIREVIQYGLAAVYQQDSTKFEVLKKSLPIFVKQDFDAEKKRWEPYRNGVFRKFSAAFYDNFLKINGQQNGSKSYDRLIYHLIDKKAKTGFYY